MGPNSTLSIDCLEQVRRSGVSRVLSEPVATENPVRREMRVSCRIMA